MPRIRQVEIENVVGLTNNEVINLIDNYDEKDTETLLILTPYILDVELINDGEEQTLKIKFNSEQFESDSVYDGLLNELYDLINQYDNLNIEITDISKNNE